MEPVFNAEKESPPETAGAAGRFGRREGAFLALAFLAACGYAFLHDGPLLAGDGHLPGIGLTLTQWALIAFALLFAGREGRLRPRPGGVFFLVIALGLGACCTVFSDEMLRLMNLPVMLLTTALALFSLTGATEADPLTGQGLREGCRRFVPAFFSHVGAPFRALRNRQLEADRRPAGIGTGLLLGIPAALLAALLLASADNVFGSMIADAAQFLLDLPMTSAVRVGIALAGTLLLFSFLCATAQKAVPAADAEKKALNPVSYGTVLALLAAVYALFVYVQIRFLFGGAETAAMAGGYAAYARSGFFQLVLLALLTLGLILPALVLCADSKWVRALCAVVALLTGVIDFSAFFRMRLYIQTYGLTLLRVVTLWGIGMILLSLLAALVQCAWPAAKICPVLTVLALGSWLLLNGVNVDMRIAQYQISRYNEGALSDLDVYYLARLSPDVLPALEELKDDSLREAALDLYRDTHGRHVPRAYDWSLGWLRVERIDDGSPAAPVPDAAVHTQSRFALDSAASYDGRFLAQVFLPRDPESPVTLYIRDARMNEALCRIQPTKAGDFAGVCWEDFSCRLWVQLSDGSLACYAPQWTQDPEAARPWYLQNEPTNQP